MAHYKLLDAIESADLPYTATVIVDGTWELWQIVFKFNGDTSGGPSYDCQVTVNAGETWIDASESIDSKGVASTQGVNLVNGVKLSVTDLGTITSVSAWLIGR